MTQKPLPCRECGKVTSNLYWRSPSGKPLKQPICNGCYEDGMRRLVREETDERKHG